MTKRHHLHFAFLFGLALLSQRCAPEQGLAAHPGPSATTKRVNASGGLKMRASDSLDSRVLALVPEGASVAVIQERGPEVEISGRKGKWSLIEWNGQRGWAFGGFLAPDSGDIAALLKSGGCIPFSHASNQKCSFSSDAACFEGVKLLPDGKAFIGGCDAGETGTWTVSGSTITLVLHKDRIASCRTGCWLESYDPDKSALCEKARKCADRSGSDVTTATIERQKGGAFVLLPNTALGPLQQPE